MPARRFVRLVLTAVGLLLAAVILLLVAAAVFAEVESRYQCAGELSSDGSSRPLTVYMRLTEYRWWVGVWSDSAGHVWVEVPNTTLDYYPHIDHVADQRHIAELDHGQPRLKGNFSTLSHTLALDTSIGFFDGTCMPINH